MHRLGHTTQGATLRNRGFSLIELVISMAIMVMLVGFVSMRAGGVSDRARAAKIIQTIDSLATPVTLYHQDTGELPNEYSGWQGSTYHRLSANPGVDGWDGPYISDPIRRSWNPTGGSIHLFNYVVSGYTNDNGIDVDGDGVGDVTGTNGSIVTFWDVPEEIARKVDAAYDDGIPGNWHDAGKVEYQAAERRLSCLIYSF